ncbi:MAG: hypothetical protein OEY44_02005 [Candidatus Peregrinibacteria bacterium]|nr:hypothetical protein [Candidatus Peregrinibacteria bacterium]
MTKGKEIEAPSIIDGHEVQDSTLGAPDVDHILGPDATVEETRAKIEAASQLPPSAAMRMGFRQLEAMNRAGK